MSIRDIIADLSHVTSPANVERAGLTSFARHHARIFEDGKNANGGPIGQYSTEPTYVNPANSPRTFPTRGKGGQSKFKNGKPHATRYFPDGYKGFRSINGRPTNVVNLKLSGDLSRSYVPGLTRRGYAFGFISKAFSEIADGNESRFNAEIFAASDEEIDIFINTLTERL